MNRPKPTSMLIASTWVSHVSSDAYWEEMREVVDSEPERAWRLVLTMVAAAPDYGTIATIAAGPVEDLIGEHGEWLMPLLEKEAESNARLRICLRATYTEFTPALRAIIEAETADIRDLPIGDHAAADGKDVSLIIGWLHHSETTWASEFLRTMSANDPPAAWDILRVLAVFADEDPRLRDEVFDDAFEPFIREHFNAFRDSLTNLGKKSQAFREWVREQHRPPVIDDREWAAFVSDISVA